MFNECATSAFQRQGSDRNIGHWSLLPRRATEPIAASLILNIAISEPLLIDDISRKFGPRSGPTKSLKLTKPDGFPDFYHTFESTCKIKAPMGLRGRSGWSLPLTKSGSRGFKQYMGVW